MGSAVDSREMRGAMGKLLGAAEACKLQLKKDCDNLSVKTENV